MEELLQTAPVTTVLLGLILVASLAAFNDESLKRRWMLHPYGIVNGGRSFTIFTSAFIHNDTMHLLFNGLALYFFGPTLERVVGPLSYVLIYLAGILFSDLTTIVRHRDDPRYYALGASGVISAVILAFVMLFPMAMIGVFFMPPMPGWLFGLLYIGFSMYASRKQYDNVAHEVHLWGALIGVVMVLLLWMLNFFEFEPGVITFFKDMMPEGLNIY
ncbi:MAG: rhomboid family intramembrane serine protease [Bacteroidota bacterium]|nr:rhomboid family intramembrane serine protease [Bacteroidota bacterium]